MKGAGPALAAALAAATPLAGAGFLIAYPDAPPPGTTGGFGEPTCVSCHFATTPDSLGSLALHGLPATLEAGRRYELTVELAHPDMAAAGFQLSARFASGPANGRQAGAFRILGDHTAVTAQSGVDYVHQTRAGSVPSTPALARWRIEWTAPGEASAPVLFHVAANAANGDESPLGDRIYTLEETVDATPACAEASPRRASARPAVAATTGSASAAAASSACVEPSPVFRATIAAFRAIPFL